MGRGRQKAKQTKVARELKYYSPATDYHQLEQELRGATGENGEPEETEDEGTEYEDRWAIADDEDATDYDDDAANYEDIYAKWADVAEKSEA